MESDEHDEHDDVGRTLAKHRRSRRAARIVATVVGLAVATTALVVWQLRRNRPPDVQYDVQTIARGAIETTAVATGNLEPQRVVEIGAEISGQIASVEVEVNDRVTTGEVLAKFDLESLENALSQARASVAVARADVRRAEAALELATVARDRLSGLAGRSFVAAKDFDEARIAHQRATADLSAARAQVELARTRLALAQTNLDKAVITSPIDGVVLQRSVEPGNTVASSFQAPVLFVIAENLDRMQLHVAIDEADVGDVHERLAATFTVDAYPDRTFEAAVVTVYLYPTITNSVVTYEALLDVDNTDGLLRPGMTATTTIVTGRHDDVLLVPNAAFDYQPSVALEPRGRAGLPMLAGPRRRTPGGGQSSRKAVWVLRDGEPVRVSVAAGGSDGQFTEIVEGDVEVGAGVIVAETVGRREDES